MVQPDRLSAPSAKLRRAEQHIERLDDAVGRYLNGEGRAPIMNKQADGVTLVVEVPMLREPPGCLSLILGDALHNLRSALDYLAWQLVLANGRTPTEHTQFPIYDNRLTKKGKPRSVDVDGGIDGQALTLIERLQPYHRVNDPARHPLSILRHLSNVDKHRTLHMTKGATDALTCALSFEDGTRIQAPPFSPRATDDDTLIVGVFRWEAGSTLPSNVNVEVSGTNYVILMDGPANRPVLLTVKELLKFERHVVLPALTPFLS